MVSVSDVTRSSVWVSTPTPTDMSTALNPTVIRRRHSPTSAVFHSALMEL